jgi:hypothetical protein
MRLFAWALVVVGVGLIAASPLYAKLESERLYRVWIDTNPREGGSLQEAEAAVHWLSKKVRMMGRGERPAWTVASPWPAVAAGAAVTAFGILLLAILRRPKGANKDETR